MCIDKEENEFKCLFKDSSMDEFRRQQEEEERNNPWEDLIMLPYYKGKIKEENEKFLNIKKEDVAKELNDFFKERFDINEDLTIKFEKVLVEILKKEYFLLEYRDIKHNLKKLFNKKFITREERNKQEGVENLFNLISYELDKLYSNKANVWREMRESFIEEFKNIKIKNKRKKTKFSGFDLPAAGCSGFEGRMEYERIRYMIKEQGLTIEEEIFCTTSVYVMSILEVKQGLLFREYGINLLENMTKETLKKFYDDLINLKNINNLL